MRILALIALLTVGCADGTSTLSVTVTSEDQLTGLERMTVQVTDLTRARKSEAFEVNVPSKPFAIPPPVSFSLVLPSDVRGRIGVQVELESPGRILRFTEETDVTPSRSSDLTITIPGAAQPDMLAADLSAQPDLASPPDMTQVDLIGADLTPPPDMPPPPDMTFVPPSFHAETVPGTCATCDLLSLWQSGDGHAYAVGAGGVILHSLSSTRTWDQMNSGTVEELRDVWGLPTGEIYVVGAAGTLLRGSVGSSTWTPLTSGVTLRLSSVWAGSNTDIYVVGDSGTIRRSTDNGTNWAATTGASGTTLAFLRVWGGSSTNIYAVGEGGVARRSINSGAAWTSHDVPGFGDCNWVWGTAAADVWTGCNNLRRTIDSGTNWVLQRTGGFTSVWGTGIALDNVWAIDGSVNMMHHMQIGSWSTVTLTAPGALRAIRGRSAADFYLVGLNKSILHYY